MQKGGGKVNTKQIMKTLILASLLILCVGLVNAADMDNVYTFDISDYVDCHNHPGIRDSLVSGTNSDGLIPCNISDGWLYFDARNLGSDSDRHELTTETFNITYHDHIQDGQDEDVLFSARVYLLNKQHDDQSLRLGDDVFFNWPINEGEWSLLQTYYNTSSNCVVQYLDGNQIASDCGCCSDSIYDNMFATQSVNGFSEYEMYIDYFTTQSGNSSSDYVGYEYSEYPIVESNLTVDTLESTNVTKTTAILHGNLTNLDTSSAEVYFEFNYGGSWYNSVIDADTLSSPGRFNYTLENLPTGETVTYRAVAEEDGITKYGIYKNLTTAVGEKSLYAITSTGQLMAYDLNGSLVFNKTVHNDTLRRMDLTNDYIFTITQNNDVKVFDLEGNEVTSYPVDTHNSTVTANDIYADEDLNTYIAYGEKWGSYGYLLKYNSSGELEWNYSKNGINNVVGKDGIVYVARTSYVESINATNGSRLEQSSQRDFFYRGIDIGPDGYIFAGDDRRYINRLHPVTLNILDSHFFAKYDVGNTDPIAVEVSSNGVVLISASWDSQTYWYNYSLDRFNTMGTAYGVMSSFAEKLFFRAGSSIKTYHENTTLLWTEDAGNTITDLQAYQVQGGSDDGFGSSTYPVKPILYQPEVGSTGVSTNPTLSVVLSRGDNITQNISLYKGSTKDMASSDLLATFTNVSSGEQLDYTWSGLNYSTRVYWYAVGSIGDQHNMTDVFYFDTQSEDTGGGGGSGGAWPTSDEEEEEVEQPNETIDFNESQNETMFAVAPTPDFAPA